MFKSTIPIKKNFITAVGSESHGKAYKELCWQSIIHIQVKVSYVRAVLIKLSPTYLIKFSLV